MTLERTIEAALVRSVEKMGGQAYKFTSPARRGVPDRIVVLPGGRVMFVEVKSSRGVLSALQEIEISRLRDLGVRVEVVRSAAEVAEVLR